MKPGPFVYHAPSTLDEALAALEEGGWDAKVIAGGQSLVPAMNFRLAQPGVLIDLNGIAELAGIEPAGSGGVRIGAMTRQRAVERSALVAERAPLLAEAMPNIAHPQIRNRGTFGGSLVHADPASELPAVILALGARLCAKSRAAERWIEAKEFFLGLFMTALEPDELLVEIEIPPLPPRTGCAFLEIARRHGDFALVGVAAVVTLDGEGRCSQARLTYTGVSDGPLAAEGAAAGLAGTELDEAAIAAAARAAAASEMDPPADVHASSEYRRQLARVLTMRALRTAAERARAGDGAED